MRFLACVFCFFAGIMLSGCGSNSLPQSELDRAQEAVETGLNAWKRGDSSKSLTAKSIEISDPDWMAGLLLKDFKVVRMEGELGGNARCTVALSLEDRAASKTNKEVVYDINIKNKNKTVIGRDPLY